MVVVISKLYEATGKKKYKNSLMLSAKAFELFRAKNGALYNTVDYRNDIPEIRGLFLGSGIHNLNSAGFLHQYACFPSGSAVQRACNTL